MNLSERDRRTLMILIGFFVCVGIYLVIDWGLGGGGGDSVEAKQTEIRQIIDLYRRFQETQANFQAVEKAMQRAGDVELLSELENLARKAEVANNIEQMDKKKQPKNPFYDEEAVEVRLQRITIEQLRRYLYEIEYSTKVLRVKELTVEVRFDNKNLMNVRVLVSKFGKPSGKAA
ncbi:MAG: hypothetical protein H6684_08435 [Deltaproteobacteria bacterium]|nr:hypothetical protein [bacterium]MCB9477483.1 hypothetical protein [Deltaproteobacteria bacterium]MCB9479300.1 hypothetical protein [Deltaproteobacteria bacterium]MCB9488744.1 hypothetical protein [Deltaproteobacteria bacterium]